MAIRLASITINNGETTVTVNSPAIDLTTLVQNGYELMVDGLSLPLTIVSGGNNSLEIAPEDAPTTTLTARAAKIIQTKGPLKEALTGLESARQVLVDFKDSVSAAADADSIAQRDGSGRLSVATPTNDNHAVNKGFLKGSATRDVANPGDTDTSKLMPVGFAGMGKYLQLPSGSSLKGDYSDGFYYLPNATDRPTSAAANWYLHVQYTNNTGFAKHTITAVSTIDGTIATYSILKINGDWEPSWAEHFHSGNSKNTIDIGLGALLSATGFNTLDETTFRYFNDTPLGYAVGMSLRANKDAGGPTWNGDMALRENTLVYRTFQNSSADISAEEWVTSYDTGNLKIDEIGGLGNNDEVLRGVAINTTTGMFHRQNLSGKLATGITFNAGSFRVDTVNGVLVTTNQPTIDTNLTSTSCDAIVVDVTGQGLTAGDIVRLRCDGGAASATIQR